MPGSDCESTSTPSMTCDLACALFALAAYSQSRTPFMVRGAPRRMKIASHAAGGAKQSRGHRMTVGRRGRHEIASPASLRSACSQ